MRTAGNGFWKATVAEKEVKFRGKIVGHKKTLVYHEGKHPKGSKTNWIMHEFVLSDPPPRQRAGVDDMRLDDWVLCKVYKKNKSVKGVRDDHHEISDAMPQQTHPMPLPPAATPPAAPVSSIPPPPAFDPIGQYPSNMINDQQPPFSSLANFQLSAAAPVSSIPHPPSDFDLMEQYPSNVIEDQQQPFSRLPNLQLQAAAPVSSTPPPHPPDFEPMVQYPSNMIDDPHQPFPNLPNFELSTATSASSFPLPVPDHFDLMDQYPSNKIDDEQQPFPSLPNFGFSDEDSYFLNVDFAC